MTSHKGGCDVADCGLCTTPAMFMVSHDMMHKCSKLNCCFVTHAKVACHSSVKLPFAEETLHAKRSTNNMMTPRQDSLVFF